MIYRRLIVSSFCNKLLLLVISTCLTQNLKVCVLVFFFVQVFFNLPFYTLFIYLFLFLFSWGGGGVRNNIVSVHTMLSIIRFLLFYIDAIHFFNCFYGFVVCYAPPLKIRSGLNTVIHGSLISTQTNPTLYPQGYHVIASTSEQ